MENITSIDARTRLAALTQTPGESALLLVGEPGIGKSHLLDQVHAERQHDSVLVRAQPAEADFPLSGFALLFAALRHEPSTELTRHLSLRSEEPRHLFAAAHDLLALVQGLKLPPTLALIDDIDRMDSASQTLLGTMAPRLAGTSLWLAATAADIEPGTVLTGISVARLQPLSVDELLENVAHDGESDEATLRILAGYTGGNPRIFAEQLARLPAEQRDGAASLVLPPRQTPTIAQVTERVVRELTPERRALLDRAAIAPMSHQLALSGLVPDGSDLVEDLVDDGLLSGQGSIVTVADPRLRSRLYWEQASRTRRAHHRELAEASAPHDERLATWHASATTRDGENVDDVLAAANSLVRESHVTEAVELVEGALGHGVAVADHADAMIHLCSHLLRHGQLGLAARYSRRTQAEALESGRAMDILTIRLLAEMFHERRLVDDEILTIAELHAPAHPDAAASILILAAFYRAERWEIDEARRLAATGMALTDAVTPATSLKLRATWDIVEALEGLADTTPHGLSPEDIDPTTQAPDLLLLRGRALTWEERHTDARHVFNLVLNHPAGQFPIWHDLATFATISNEIGAGQFRLARTAIDAWGSTSAWISRATPVYAFIRAWYAYSLGDVAETTRWIDRCLQIASQEATQAVRARALSLRGSMHLLTGDLDAAVMDLRQVSAISTRLRNPSLLRHWADYTEACVLTDRVQEAAAAVAALERRLSAHRSRWGELALLRSRALIETSTASLALFEHAVKDYGRDGSPYELGRTLRCLAERQQLLGMGVEGARTRLAAIVAFEASGAPAWAERTDRPAPAEEAALPSSLLDRLTVEERAVANHVLHGLRNREIAQALFVSVRTVELRLTRIYRALEVQSRAQLVAVLSGSRHPSSPPADEPT
jgi:DNA-binding CsgD family transcriptional regulator/urease gamma subunit